MYLIIIIVCIGDRVLSESKLVKCELTAFDFGMCASKKKSCVIIQKIQS